MKNEQIKAAEQYAAIMFERYSSYDATADQYNDAVKQLAALRSSIVSNLGATSKPTHHATVLA